MLKFFIVKCLSYSISENGPFVNMFLVKKPGLLFLGWLSRDQNLTYPYRTTCMPVTLVKAERSHPHYLLLFRNFLKQLDVCISIFPKNLFTIYQQRFYCSDDGKPPKYQHMIILNKIMKNTLFYTCFSETSNKKHPTHNI